MNNIVNMACNGSANCSLYFKYLFENIHLDFPHYYTRTRTRFHIVFYDYLHQQFQSAWDASNHKWICAMEIMLSTTVRVYAPRRDKHLVVYIIYNNWSSCSLSYNSGAIRIQKHLVWQSGKFVKNCIDSYTKTNIFLHILCLLSDERTMQSSELDRQRIFFLRIRHLNSR